MEEENKLGAAEEISTTETTVDTSVEPTIEETKTEDIMKELDELRARTSVPEEYSFDSIESIGESEAAEFSEFARKAGLTQDQATTVINEYKNIVSAQHGKMEEFKEEMRVKSMESLKSEFGDDLTSKLEGARKVVIDLGGEGLSNYLDDTGLGNNPELIKTFIKMSELIGEDSKATIGAGTKSTGSKVSARTPEEAKKELAEIFKTKATRKSAINPLDPNSKNETKRILELAKLAALKEG